MHIHVIKNNHTLSHIKEKLPRPFYTQISHNSVRFCHFLRKINTKLNPSSNKTIFVDKFELNVFALHKSTFVSFSSLSLSLASALDLFSSLTSSLTTPGNGGLRSMPARGVPGNGVDGCEVLGVGGTALCTEAGIALSPLLLVPLVALESPLVPLVFESPLLGEEELPLEDEELVLERFSCCLL